MKFIISGTNLEVTGALKDRVERKLGKLSKFFKTDTEAHVTLSVQKNRQIVEVTIYFDGRVLRAEESSEDMYASIDKVVDVLEGQIRRYKTKLGKAIREGAFISQVTETNGGMGSESDKEYEEEKEFKIVRTKRFAIKPMTPEEAILQMNLLGHQFFMFLNAEDMQPNVVYKRKNGDYGLIAPEFD